MVVIKKFLQWPNAFLRSLSGLDSTDVSIGVAVFVVSCSLLVPLSSRALINGDAAVYIEAMRELHFDERTVHIGYFVLGALLIRVFPGSDDYIMNATNCVLGAVIVAVVYFIAVLIGARRQFALFASALMLTNFVLLLNSLFAEVYAPQTAFYLLSLLLWLLNRPIIAGLLFACSVLMSPSSFFALPLLFFLRPEIRALALFCITAAVVVLIAVVPNLHDYMFGGRGIVAALGPAADSPSMSVAEKLSKVRTEVLSKGLFMAVPFIATGLFTSIIDKNRRAFGVGLLTTWLIIVLFAEKFYDVPVALPIYALLAVAGAVGLEWMWQKVAARRWQAVAVVVVAMGGLAFMAATTFQHVNLVRLNRRYFREDAMAIKWNLAPNSIIVCTWDKGRLFEHYVDGDRHRVRWIDYSEIRGFYGGRRRSKVLASATPPLV